MCVVCLMALSIIFEFVKILIIAYEYPPLISIGGQRPYYWARYWSELGAQITVVTRHWSSNTNSAEDFVKPTQTTTNFEKSRDEVSVIRTAYKPNLRDLLLIAAGTQRFELIRKILSLAYSLLEWVSFSFDSKSSIYYEARSVLDRQKFDLIIATGQPFILFRYASKLSKEFGIPWVADYRDCWTSNQGGYKLSFVQKNLHRFFRAQEIKIVHTADYITTAAQPYKDEIGRIFTNKKIEVIYNGYDDSLVKDIKGIVSRRDKYVIAYAGMIYPHQKLELFLQGVEDLVKGGIINERNFEIIFYAIDSYSDARNRLLNFSEAVTPLVKTTSRIEYKNLLAKLRESHLLLLLSKKNANWVNTKLFDYFAVKRPVLLVESDEGVLDDLIKSTNAGYSCETVDSVKECILKEFQKFMDGIEPEQNLQPLHMLYTRKNQSKILFDIIKSNIDERI